MITLRPLIQMSRLPSSKLKFLTLCVAAACCAPLTLSAASAETGNLAAESIGSNAPQLAVDAFMKCTDLKLESARLACYDKVAAGEEIILGREKLPLDLVETVKASFSDFRPTAVFANEDNEASEADAADSEIVAEAEGKAVTGAPTAFGEEQLAKAGITVDDFAAYTPLSLAYDLDKNNELGTWTVRPHRAIYLLPAYVQYSPNLRPETPTLHPNEAQFDEYGNKYADKLELKAQISLKTKILEDVFDTNADVWFGYTQQMHWQVYNDEHSRPFRATDYMPEMFITQPVKADLPFNGRLRMLGAGAIHHSNGQSDPWSRSWNRLYLMGGAEWGKFSLQPKIWTHVKEKDSSKSSDNPDITDYYGHGELKALYDFGRGETLSALGRYNFETDKGAVQLDYTVPISRDVYGFIQIFHGYGESIIDYNKETTAVGVGLSLNDWKGL